MSDAKSAVFASEIEGRLLYVIAEKGDGWLVDAIDVWRQEDMSFFIESSDTVYKPIEVARQLAPILLKANAGSIIAARAQFDRMLVSAMDNVQADGDSVDDISDTQELDIERVVSGSVELNKSDDSSVPLDVSISDADVSAKPVHTTIGDDDNSGGNGEGSASRVDTSETQQVLRERFYAKDPAYPDDFQELRTIRAQQPTRKQSVSEINRGIRGWPAPMKLLALIVVGVLLVVVVGRLFGGIPALLVFGAMFLIVAFAITLTETQ